MSQWESFTLLKTAMTTGLGVAPYKNRLYFGFQSDNVSSSALYVASLEWDGKQPVNPSFNQPLGWDAREGIGMAVFNDRLYMAYEGTGSGGIYVAYSDGETWGTKTHLADWDTNVGIGMTVFNNQLFMAYQGTGSGGIYIASSSDGENWATVKHESNWGAKAGIGLTTYQGKLYMAYQGTGSGGIYIASSDDGQSWTSERITGWEASLGIGLASFNGRLYMAYEGTGTGNRLYVASTGNPSGNPGNWYSKQIAGWDANGGLGMATFSDNLFMVYEGTGSGYTYAGVRGK